MNTATRFEVGQRVTATLWGQKQEGTVVGHYTSVVWVQWDGKEAPSWQHPESLTVLA